MLVTLSIKGVKLKVQWKICIVKNWPWMTGRTVKVFKFSSVVNNILYIWAWKGKRGKGIGFEFSVWEINTLFFK